MSALEIKKEPVPVSRFRGVYAFRAATGAHKYQCSLAVTAMRSEHLGTYSTEVAAVRAFDARVRALGRGAEANLEAEEARTPARSGVEPQYGNAGGVLQQPWQLGQSPGGPGSAGSSPRGGGNNGVRARDRRVSL